MKTTITDFCHIDASMLTAVLSPPAIREFIRETYLHVLVEATNFIEESSLEDGIDADKLDLDGLYIDWHAGEIETTVTMELKLKFELVNDRLRVTGVGFHD